MQKLFISGTMDTDVQTYQFVGDEAKYLRDVIRMRIGDRFVIGDSEGMDIQAEIVSVNKELVSTVLLSREKNRKEPPYQATLYQGLMKGDKMEWLIQKSVELGVSEIVPVVSSRCIAKINEKDTQKKITRWQKIALEAARQSGRGNIPTVSEPILFLPAILRAAKKSLFAFQLWENETEMSLRNYLETKANKIEKFSSEEILCSTNNITQKACISFFVGPEGGFSEEEVHSANLNGIDSVSLGRRILRTETAGLYVLSALSYRLELF